MNPRDASDVRQSVRVHQLRLEKLDRAVEASVGLERTSCRAVLRSAAQERHRFLNAQRLGCIRFAEGAPDSQGGPLDISAKHAARNTGDTNLPRELAPQLGIEFDVERRRAVRSDFVGVGLVIVKDDDAAAAQPLVASRAFAVAAAQHVGEERRSVSVLWQMRVRLVDRFERMETGSAQRMANVPGGRRV